MQEFMPAIENICQRINCAGMFKNVVVRENCRLQTTIGRARIKHGVYIVELNPRVWNRATTDERAKTIIHEVCHLGNYFLLGRFDRNYQGHGSHWSQLMRLCNLDPTKERYHCVSVTGLKRKQRRFHAHCKCGNIKNVTMTIARRIHNGRHRYTCRVCQGLIKLGKAPDDFVIFRPVSPIQRINSLIDLSAQSLE